MATTTISMPQELLDWVRDNHISLSSLVQEEIKKLMDNQGGGN